jgi:hypothetical protein
MTEDEMREAAKSLTPEQIAEINAETRRRRDAAMEALRKSFRRLSA